MDLIIESLFLYVLITNGQLESDTIFLFILFLANSFRIRLFHF